MRASEQHTEWIEGVLHKQQKASDQGHSSASKASQNPRISSNPAGPSGGSGWQFHFPLHNFCMCSFFSPSFYGNLQLHWRRNSRPLCVPSSAADTHTHREREAERDSSKRKENSTATFTPPSLSMKQKGRRTRRTRKRLQKWQMRGLENYTMEGETSNFL